MQIGADVSSLGVVGSRWRCGCAACGLLWLRSGEAVEFGCVRWISCRALWVDGGVGERPRSLEGLARRYCRIKPHIVWTSTKASVQPGLSLWRSRLFINGASGAGAPVGCTRPGPRDSGAGCADSRSNRSSVRPSPARAAGDPHPQNSGPLSRSVAPTSLGAFVAACTENWARIHLRRSSEQIGTIQRMLAWHLRKDDTRTHRDDYTLATTVGRGWLRGSVFCAVSLWGLASDRPGGGLREEPRRNRDARSPAATASGRSPWLRNRRPLLVRLLRDAAGTRARAPRAPSAVVCRSGAHALPQAVRLIAAESWRSESHGLDRCRPDGRSWVEAGSWMPIARSCVVDSGACGAISGGGYVEVRGVAKIAPKPESFKIWRRPRNARM